MFLKKVILGVVRFFGFEIISTSTHARLSDWKYNLVANCEFGKELDAYKTKLNPHDFRSQLGQDYLAFKLFGSEGFFVEFGATNGVELSNSYALEQLGWKGVLAEPSKQWHAELAKNRPDTLISHQCVWKTSGESIKFTEATSGTLSTVSEFLEADHHKRQKLDSYEVQTISLEDLLVEAEAPEFVEFLSIDTEGSEYEILKHFNWEDRSFGLIAVEHNHTALRGQIFDLLTEHGYTRILEQHSRWDDWYINDKLKIGSN